jgi:hypothetical protein
LTQAVGHNRNMSAWAATVGAFLAWLLFRDRRRKRMPGRAQIVSPPDSTVVADDGAVHSLQSARLELPRAELKRLWAPEHLDNLGRTYWRFLTRATLGAIRVHYADDGCAVVLLVKPFTLLRFGPPEYTVEPEHGRITWAIRDGLLVARGGHGSGFLSVDVRTVPETGEPAVIDVQVEVANFYPAIASGFGTAIYESTQSFVHVLVTHAFLRSLATLELAGSRAPR